MKISTDIKPITDLKSHSAGMLKQVNETHRPIVITQKVNLKQTYKTGYAHV